MVWETHNCHLSEYFEVLALGHRGASLYVCCLGLAEARDGVQLNWSISNEHHVRMDEGNEI